MPNLNVDTSLANRIPVSMVTGFLGSGKTTLINYLIEQAIALARMTFLTLPIIFQIN